MQADSRMAGHVLEVVTQMVHIVHASPLLDVCFIGVEVAMSFLVEEQLVLCHEVLDLSVLHVDDLL